MVDYGEIRTVNQMASEAVFLTESKMRWWIFHPSISPASAGLFSIRTLVAKPIDPSTTRRCLAVHPLPSELNYLVLVQPFSFYPSVFRRPDYSTSSPTLDWSTIFGKFSASARTVDADPRAAMRRKSS